MTDVGWLAALPALLVSVALLLAPGLIVLAPLRMGMIARSALAGAVSIALIGAAGAAFSLVGLGFAFWQPLVLAAAGGAVVWALRGRAVVLPRDGRSWPILVSWAASAAVVAAVAYAAVPAPALVSQTYDNVFHLSAIASILDTGDASSLTLRTLIETGKDFSFYPSGWHSLVALTVQLTGAQVAVAVNATWLAVIVAVWLPGAAWLAQVCVARAQTAQVAMIALPLAAAFGAFPYALLSWGTLYPTALATALLPVAVAVPVLAWRGWRADRTEGRLPIVVWSAAGAAATLAAIAFSQPRALATWALLLAVPAVAVVVGALVRGWRRGGRSRRRVVWTLATGGAALLLAAAVGFWYLVARLGLFERPLDDRLGGPQAQAVQSVWTGVWQVVAQSALVGDGATATAPALLLAAAVVIGVVAACRRPQLRWVVGSYALVALLYVLAAGSDDVVTKLATGLWYKDRYRLSSALPVLGVVLGTLGILWVANRLPQRSSTRRRPSAPVLTWLVTFTSAAALALSGMSAAIGNVFRMPETAASDAVVSRTQIEFFRGLADTVPEGQRVLGDPWDGSAWTLVYGDREPVFPHVNGQWDPDRVTLAWHLADIETDPEVCAALDRLRVRYVTYAPHAFGGGDPAGNHFPGPHAAVDAGLFTLVDTDGDAGLYRIDQCGPLP